MTERIRRLAYASLSLALLTYAVINWLTTIRELRRFYTNMWIWDPWDYLAHFAAYKRFDLSILWIQHNEHRIIGTEIAYVLDILLLRGRQIMPEIIGIAAYLGALLVLVAFVWFWTADHWSMLCAALFVAGIAGYKICVVSLASPFLTCWPQWEFFSVAALATLALHQKRGGTLLLILSLALAVVATYSIASGMLLWPLLVSAGLLLRLKPRETTVIAGCGAVSTGLYFFHYTNLPRITLAGASHHPKYLAMFLGSFLGMPFSTAYDDADQILLTSICGWIAISIATVDLTWIIRKKLLATPSVIVLGGFCCLVFASAMLTAVGRMDPADTSMKASRAGRYLTEPTLFWCALLLLTVWLIGKAWKGYAAFLFLITAGIVSAGTLPRSSEYYNWWVNYFQRGQWAAIGLANGVTDGSVSDILFPGREYVTQFKHVLTDNHLAMFAGPEPGWIGHQASKLFARGSDGYIHGEVTSVRRLGNDYEVQGWADGADTVVFVDETGLVVGFGMRPKAGPAELYTRDVPRNFAFTGFIRGEFGAHRFSLWAVDRKGRQISGMGDLKIRLPQ